MKPLGRVVSFGIALCFTAPMIPPAAARSHPAAGQIPSSVNRGKGGAAGIAADGRVNHHTRQIRKPNRNSWWDVIG